jgi:decaprenylphospho-beta-D-erythro-pentofuranosid-2-ulose 2-reductase
MESIVLFGATSGIAQAVARKLVSEGENLILIGRSQAALVQFGMELEKSSGRAMPCIVWDVLDFTGHGMHFRSLVGSHAVKGVLFAAGLMIPQDECDKDPEKTKLTLDTNFTGPTMILSLFAEYFRLKGTGFISCVSSVAGDRGRGKVLAYAAAKAGLSAYLAGLSHRLAGTGVLVQTIKPGFVKTKMVGNMQSPLMATPERVAKEIVSAIRNRREVVYTPFFWRYIMLLIKTIPSPIFKRMKL